MIGLKKLKIKLPLFSRLIQPIQARQFLHKAFLYTTEETEREAKQNHGSACFDGIRMKHGIAITSQNSKGKPQSREKGVDAQLVTDMIYHAASRNAKHVLLVANDADFSFALRRVEDFGCSTELRWIGQEPCAALQSATDIARFFSIDELTSFGASRE